MQNPKTKPWDWGAAPQTLLVSHIGVNIGVLWAGGISCPPGAGGFVGIFSLGEGAEGAERTPLEKSQQ